MLVLFPDTLHDIGHSVFDLLLDALDTLLLFVGQVEACIEGVSSTTVYLDGLLVLEELLFRDETGAGG